MAPNTGIRSACSASTFNEEGNDPLEEVSWDEWFKTFGERNLVLLFQEKLKNGDQSNFFRFDNPEREDA